MIESPKYESSTANKEKNKQQKWKMTLDSLIVNTDYSQDILMIL